MVSRVVDRVKQRKCKYVDSIFFQINDINLQTLSVSKDFQGDAKKKKQFRCHISTIDSSRNYYVMIKG